MSNGSKRAIYAAVAGIGVVGFVLVFGLRLHSHKIFYVLLPGALVGMWLRWNVHGFFGLGIALVNACFYAGIGGWCYGF